MALSLIKACAKVLRNGCRLPKVVSDSPQYDTPGKLTPRSMIPWGDGLAGVLYCREIFMKNLINAAKSYQNQRYFNLLVSGPGRFEL